MKKFRKLAEKPIIGPIIKKAMDYLVNREVSSIAKHFSNYLTPTLANTSDLKETSYKMRHEVYCEEFDFLPKSDSKMETDHFDIFSYHCLIQHTPTGRYAGTVRIVSPQNEGEQIPIEKYCLNSINVEQYNPANFPRHEICEISRLAVPAEFRRRQSDKYAGAATGEINEQVYSERELRCFPFIAVGLYLSAASVVINKDIKHTYVMMEPRLARSMRFVGIQFDQIGPAIDYHGMRAPYYINPRMLLKNLSPGFKDMLTEIRKHLKHN